MISLKVKYLGLELRNPIIIGSSGLTGSLENLVEYEKQGAGAVVLKSLFEEQILHEIHHTMSQDEMANLYPEALDYIGEYSKGNNLGKYLTLVRDASKSLSIPVIASINCFTADDWVTYAGKIEEAGASALELNLFILPSDPLRSSELNEKIYFEILEAVLKTVKMPVSLKISPYFSGLAEISRKFEWAGAKGLVLFNRFYSPDIDIDTLKILPAQAFSEPVEIYNTLRWIALLSGSLKCDLAASTGIHQGKDLIKMLLAGASAVEVVSTIYKNGSGQISKMLSDLENWMDKHEYTSIEQFKGILNFKQVSNPAAYERVQFMKHFAGIE